MPSQGGGWSPPCEAKRANFGNEKVGGDNGGGLVRGGGMLGSGLRHSGKGVDPGGEFCRSSGFRDALCLFLLVELDCAKTLRLQVGEGGLKRREVVRGGHALEGDGLGRGLGGGGRARGQACHGRAAGTRAD